MNTNSSTATILCPHCGAASMPGAFCETCGKALPSTQSSSPRIVDGNSLPQSAAGQKLVGDELQKQTKKAANTLLAVGILMLVFGAIMAAAMPQMPNLPMVLTIQFALGCGFIGLYVWARSSPLPAAIVGLVLYSTLVVLNVVQTMSAISQQQGSGSGIGGIGIGWLDIVIIALLAQGIQAGLKHKRLLETGATA